MIFDTLAATFLLENENDNSEASKVIKVLQNLSLALGVLCVPVHHYGKGAETGLRGASAWRAGSDAVLSVTADRNQQTGLVSNHSLWLSKSRVGEEGPLGAFALRTMAVGLDEDGDEITSCYVVPWLNKKTETLESPEAEESVMRELASGDYVMGSARNNSAISLVCEKFDLKSKNRKSTAENQLNDWIEAKKIYIEEKYDSSRNRKKYCRVSEEVLRKFDLKSIVS